MSPADPSPSDTDGDDARLAALLRAEIEAAPDRRITFARFMERALTEPGLGYYATSASRPSREGDFLTAPELHPLFGRCLGRWLTRVWPDLGRPDPFTVREYGAGRGTLAASTIAGLAADDPALARLVRWQPVDVPGRHPDPTMGSFDGVVLANEYLDALPVHRLVMRGGRIRECHVTWQDGFRWVEAEPSGPDLDAPLRRAGVVLAEGQLAEVRPSVATWLEDVTRALRRGIVLIIDYGHDAAGLYGPRRMAGSLVTYRDHMAGDDPLHWVGRQDITAHVDLTELGRAARTVGLVPLGRTTQAMFLADLGLGEMLSDLGRRPDTPAQAYLDARASVVRLLDPRHLGGFTVVAYGHGIDPSDRAAGPRSEPTGAGTSA